MPSVTITYTAQEGADIAAAIGYTDNLTDAGGLRAATAAEAKAHLIAYIKGIVRSHKRYLATQQITVTDINPT